MNYLSTTLRPIPDAELYYAAGLINARPLSGSIFLRRCAGLSVRITSSVGRTPRAYWGSYGASKAAFENLLLSYGEEVRHISGVRVGIVDPGATRTKMRARAFPGENAETVKPPEVVAEHILALAVQGFATGHFERVE